MQRPALGGQAPDGCCCLLGFCRGLLGLALGSSEQRAPPAPIHLGFRLCGDGPDQMAFIVCHITQGQKPDTSLRAQGGRYSSSCKI